MQTKPTFTEEMFLWEKGYSVVGVDEVGKGCFAGPVVAGAVIFSPHINQELSALPKIMQKDFAEINDSKLLSAQKREKLATLIKQISLAYGIGESDVTIINEKGITFATHLAMKRAIQHAFLLLQTKVNNISLSSHVVFVDGYCINDLFTTGISQQRAIIKGDQKVISIAAASIIAKVYRDSQMDDIHKQYPMYNFMKNKGYGTKEHREALHTHNMCPYHRTSFAIQKFT